jgi:hypothetical protein
MSLSVRGWNPTFVRLPQTQSAIEYAERLHPGQRRADRTPFILHPGPHPNRQVVGYDLDHDADGTQPTP